MQRWSQQHRINPCSSIPPLPWRLLPARRLDRMQERQSQQQGWQLRWLRQDAGTSICSSLRLKRRQRLQQWQQRFPWCTLLPCASRTRATMATAASPTETAAPAVDRTTADAASIAARGRHGTSRGNAMVIHDGGSYTTALLVRARGAGASHFAALLPAARAELPSSHRCNSHSSSQTSKHHKQA